MLIRKILNSTIPFFSRNIIHVAPKNSKLPTKPSPYIPTFREYNFINPLYEALDKKEFYTPTPIQQQVIPHILSKKNLFFAAQNGTGKTLAYALPIIQLIKSSENEDKSQLSEKPRALIIVPSRELAIQTKDVLKEFCHYAKFRATAFYGGDKLSIEYKALDAGLDILVSTPDRLDVLRKKSRFYISDISHLIIDEFDTLIDSGYKQTIQTYVEKTLRRNPNEKQLIFLSSTHPKHLEKYLKELEGNYKIKIPKIVDSKTHTNLANLEHIFEEVKGTDKFPYLLKHIKNLDPNSSAIVFCNSIKCAQATEHFLSENKILSTSLHGDIPHVHRYHNYLKFRFQDAKVLVATDLAARGLDFPFVSHVINFDFPESESDYLHRAGRAGRAGRKGIVITLHNKRNHQTISKLTRAFQNGTPLDVKESTFSKINKEEIQRNPQLLIESKNHKIQEKLKKEKEKEISLKNQHKDKTILNDKPKSRILYYKLRPKKSAKKPNTGLLKIQAKERRLREKGKKRALRMKNSTDDKKPKKFGKSKKTLGRKNTKINKNINKNK